MKKNLLLGMLLASSTFGFSQILSETFQGPTFPANGWTTATNLASRPWALTSAYGPAAQTSFDITGASSAMIGWIAEAQDANLTSPSFSLAGYASATFAFKAKLAYEYMVAPNPNGDLFAEISTNGGASWTQLWREEDFGVFTEYQTLPISLNLSAYLGQTNVKVRFHYVANDADSVSIDDVVIQGVLSSDSFTLSGVKMYPNPAKNVLNIQSDVEVLTKVSIVDLNGRTVKEVSNNLSQISLENLSKGIYMVTIESATAKKVEKLIVE